MSSMLQFLSKYFPNLNKNNEYNWVKIPFYISLKYGRIPWDAKEQFIKTSKDPTLKTEFSETELT